MNRIGPLSTGGWGIATGLRVRAVWELWWPVYFAKLGLLVSKDIFVTVTTEGKDGTTLGVFPAALCARTEAMNWGEQGARSLAKPWPLWPLCSRLKDIDSSIREKEVACGVMNFEPPPIDRFRRLGVLPESVLCFFPMNEAPWNEVSRGDGVLRAVLVLFSKNDLSSSIK